MNTTLTFDPTDPADVARARQVLDAIEAAFQGVNTGDADDISRGYATATAWATSGRR